MEGRGDRCEERRVTGRRSDGGSGERGLGKEENGGKGRGGLRKVNGEEVPDLGRGGAAGEWREGEGADVKKRGGQVGGLGLESCDMCVFGLQGAALAAL